MVPEIGDHYALAQERDGRALILSNPDPTLINDPSAAVTATVEEYKCGKCEKMHQRQVMKLGKG